MLILPLHRPLTRATFPLVTALLVLANAFVFFGLQLDDDGRMEAASRHYVESGLAAIEVPAFERHLAQTGEADGLRELRALDEDERGDYVAQRTATDVRFGEALAAGALFDTPQAHAHWKTLRPAYDALQQEVFTLRRLLRSNEIDPARMLSSAFLHADVMHLLGNMVFLVALGLLVEGALGSGRFLALYLLGALGASAASLAWRWGEAAGGLGASGAVAALMGAFCVVWGRQPVRFFYWFGVIFDYVRAPAIWLLPAWLGWEILNLVANADADAGVAFDAHAGGIVSGALVGAALVASRQVRSDFIADPPSTDGIDTRWERAQSHLGRMQLEQAESLLSELAADQPQRLDVSLARYRAARHAGRDKLAHECALAVLALPDSSADAVRTQCRILQELQDAGATVPDALRISLAGRWLAIGALDAAEAALDTATHERCDDTHAQLWFRLALGYGEQQASERRTRALQRVVEHFADHPQAQKARFLLENS
ncbi:rhomboid family intramembrane serine protease [Lysobacter korlensis]|uniref:Rhomboid family intramembrane serine protease n=1 Tax=Lysobacter korlensis TaxID=553636 RepID=A0ABV6RQB3_9GAMM